MLNATAISAPAAPAATAAPKVNKLAIVNTMTNSLVFFFMNGVFMCMNTYDRKIRPISELDAVVQKNIRYIENDVDFFKKSLQAAATGQLDGVDVRKLDSLWLSRISIFCRAYMEYKGVDAEVIELTKQICHASKLSHLALDLLYIQPDNKEITQIMFDYPDVHNAHMYCKKIAATPEMRQIIIDSGHADSALNYCLEISNDDDMKKIVLNSGNPNLIIRYCLSIGIDADMRQAIIESNDPHSILCYLSIVEDNDEIRNALIDCLLDRRANGIDTQLPSEHLFGKSSFD